MNNELAVRASVEAEVSGFEMKPRSLEEAMKFCELMANSDLVPSGYKSKPGNIMVAIQMGLELGMTPMRALRSIAVINGRASMWGDDLLAMVLNSPLCEYVNESDSTDQVGICKVKRKGSPEHLSRFSLDDAKRAGLLGKAGPWQQYTKRMLTLRARGFALRDNFADVLAGLVTLEEALDVPQEIPTVESTASLTLKDKLKAQVAQTDMAPPSEGLGKASPASGTPQAQDAVSEEPPMADPAEPYRARLRTCERSITAINATYHAIPDEIRQDCHPEYITQLKTVKPPKDKK